MEYLIESKINNRSWTNVIIKFECTLEFDLRFSDLPQLILDNTGISLEDNAEILSFSYQPVRNLTRSKL